jgi:acetate kinase
VDPGILVHLVRHDGVTAKALDRLLNHESGLKGVSGISGDMRELAAAMRQGNPRARLAFNIFIHRLCGGIAAMAASAGGIDALVFTAGIGENSVEVRAAAAERLEWLGIGLDSARNQDPAGADRDIAAAGSRVRVLVVKTREEQEIAREVWHFTAGR